MKNNTFLAVFLMVLLINRVQSGPFSCAACLASFGTGIAGIGGGVGTCFTLAVPPLVCSCLASFGIGIGIWGIITCTPICLFPVP